MRILLFEWLTGGGLWTVGQSPEKQSAIAAQGSAMLSAFAGDLLQGGQQVVLPIDQRRKLLGLEQAEQIPIDSATSLYQCLRDQAELADAIMIVAPETDGCLRKTCAELEAFQRKSISPNLEFIELTADKNATAARLTENGVCVPSGTTLDTIDFASELPKVPAVLKPSLGAGSAGVQLIENWDSFRPPPDRQQWRLENFVAGIPVSVSVLCGHRESRLLHPTGQMFDRSPFGGYVGAAFPLAEEIAQRANQLAAKTIEVLPATQGYIGIDMVIASNGQADDSVIEINPRLTMSYLKLREIYSENLALETLRIARQ